MKEKIVIEKIRWRCHWVLGNDPWSEWENVEESFEDCIENIQKKSMKDSMVRYQVAKGYFLKDSNEYIGHKSVIIIGGKVYED